MRYLKRFEAKHVSTIAKQQFSKEYAKINSSLSIINEYIKDILIPLSDDGYKVETDVCTNITDNHISMRISNSKYFDLDDIKDVLIHLDRYLKSKGVDSQLPHLIKYSNKASYGVRKHTYTISATGQPHTYYEFFCRFYPKKVKEIRDKMDAMRRDSS